MASFITHSDAEGSRIMDIKVEVYLARAELKGI
jgi:hypothetical protein